MATLTVFKNVPFSLNHANVLAKSNFHFEQYRGLDAALTRPVMITVALKVNKQNK